MTRVLILPGLHNSDPDHWQSRWEVQDWSLRRVIQNDWETPRCGDWVARLDQALMLTGPDAVLVAHSAGCALVAHWAIRHPSQRIRGALLVAPSDPEVPSFPTGPDRLRTNAAAAAPISKCCSSELQRPVRHGLARASIRDRVGQ